MTLKAWDRTLSERDKSSLADKTREPISSSIPLVSNRSDGRNTANGQTCAHHESVWLFRLRAPAAVLRRKLARQLPRIRIQLVRPPPLLLYDQRKVLIPQMALASKERTACFLLSAASSAAWRGLTGMLSFPPPPSPPSVRVVPTTLCPPPTVPGFEQSPPIRAGDQGKKVNVDPSHRSPPMIHRVLPQVIPRLRAFYVLDEDRYEVYNTCNSPYKLQRQRGDDSARVSYSSRLPPSRRPNRLRTPRPNSSERVRGMSPCVTKKNVNPKRKRLVPITQRTSHNSLPAVQLNRGSRPAFSIFPLMPAPSNKPNTVNRNRVTTSWSRGESLSSRKKPQLSTIPTRVRTRTRTLTETTCLHITFFPCSSIRVSISQRSAGTDR